MRVHPCKVSWVHRIFNLVHYAIDIPHGGHEHYEQANMACPLVILDRIGLASIRHDDGFACLSSLQSIMHGETTRSSIKQFDTDRID